MRLLPLLLLLLAAPSWATNRFVAPESSSPTGTWPCTDSATPCPLNTVNTSSQLVAGDIIHMAAGTYNTFPRPYIGDNPTNGVSNTHIEYRGITTSPTSVVINVQQSVSDQINNSWIRYRAIKFGKSLIVGSGPWAPIQPRPTNVGFDVCRVVGSLEFRTPRSCWFDSGYVDTTTTATRAYNRFSFQGSDDNGGGTVVGNVFSNNTMYFNTGTDEPGDGTSAEPLFLWADGPSPPPIQSGNVLRNNTINITMNPYATQATGQGPRGVYLYRAVKDTFAYNTWNLTNNSAVAINGQRAILWRARNMVNHSHFYRETWKLRGRRGFMYLASQGNNDTGCEPAGTATDSMWVGNNLYEDCLFDWEATTDESQGAFFEQAIMCSDQFLGCVFRATSGTSRILRIESIGRGSQNRDTYAILDHNTFITDSKAITPLEYISGGWESDANVRITNNIFYCNDTGTPTGVGMRFDLADNRVGTNLINGRNLFFYKPLSATAGDRDIAYRTCTSPGTGCSAVTYSAPGYDGTWFAASGEQTHAGLASRHGLVGFIDSTWTTDTDLRAAGRFRGDLTYALFGEDGYVGARPYRRLYTFRPIPEDTTSALFNYYAPTWAASGTKVQEGYSNIVAATDLDSLSNPRVYMSDSLESIAVGAWLKWDNNAVVPTVAESLAWREGTDFHTVGLTANLPVDSVWFTKRVAARQEADSAGTTSWDWSQLQFVTNYGPRVTSTWTSAPSIGSYLLLYSLPYLETWGWSRLGKNSTPSPATITHDSCNDIYFLTVGGNDSTEISDPDSAAFARDPVNNKNRRPTVEVISYNPDVAFDRSWFDGTLGTIQGNNATVIYRDVPATRTLSFTHSYTVPTSATEGHTLLRTRTTDGNGDWRNNNWVIGQPVIDRVNGGQEKTPVRKQADAVTSTSGTVVTGTEFTAFPYAEGILFIIISVANGSQAVTSATWGGQTLTFQGSHSGGNVVVEYWYLHNPTSTGTVAYAVSWDATVDATIYLMPTSNTHGVTPFSNLNSATGTSTSASTTVSGVCANRVLAVGVTNGLTTQTLSSGESTIDVGYVGITGPESISLSALAASTPSTTVTHALSASDTWLLSLAAFRK